MVATDADKEFVGIAKSPTQFIQLATQNDIVDNEANCKQWADKAEEIANSVKGAEFEIVDGDLIVTT